MNGVPNEVPGSCTPGWPHGRAELVADGPSEIDDADNVATSYPGFAAALTQLGATIQIG